MTKNEKLNNLKDLSRLYEQEIERLQTEIETINTTHTQKTNEIIVNAGRAEKRFTRSLWIFGSSILFGLFTIGVLSASPVSVILAGSLFSVGFIDFVYNTIVLSKYNKQAEYLEQMSLEKTTKVDANLKEIKSLRKKQKKVLTMIDDLSKDMYSSSKTNSTKNKSIYTNSIQSDEITKS